MNGKILTVLICLLFVGSLGSGIEISHLGIKDDNVNVYTALNQPIVVIESPENGTTFYADEKYDAAVHFSVYASSYDCLIDKLEYLHEWSTGSEYKTATFTTPVYSLTNSSWKICEPYLQEGLNKITITAFDTCEEQGSDTIFFNYMASPPDINLTRICPVQVVNNTCVRWDGVNDAYPGKTEGFNYLVANKKTLVEIWYTSSFPTDVDTKVTVTIWDEQNKLIKRLEFPRTFSPTSVPKKLEPWAPEADSPFVAEIDKPNRAIQVYITPVEEEADTTNNVLKGVFEVRKGELKIFFLRLGRTKWDLPPEEWYKQSKEKSVEFIKATYPVSKVTVIEGGELVFPSTGGQKLRYSSIVRLYKLLTAKVKLATCDVGVAMIQGGWMDYNFQAPPGEPNDFWKGTIGCQCGSYCGVLSDTGRWETPAHEIGHYYGLVDLTGTPKVAHHEQKTWIFWIEKNRLQEEGKCFMAASNPDWKTFGDWWICSDCYEKLYNKITSIKDPEIVMVSGYISKNGEATLDSWYRLMEGTLDIELGDQGDYSFVYLDQEGRELGTAGFNLSFFLDHQEDPMELDQAGFVFCIPWINETKEIQVVDADHNVLATRRISDHSPTVRVTSPHGNEVIQLGDNLTITWETEDADGDELSFAILYSNNSGETWIPIDVNVTGTSYQWTIRWPAPGNNYLIKVMATDGINTGQDVSDNPFTILPDTTPPDIAIAKPFNGLYIFDRKILPLPLTIVLGDVTVEAEADDNVAIDNVTFYFDNDLMNFSLYRPYQWFCNETALFAHTIKAHATDIAGNAATDEQRIYIFNWS
ncbi:MAG: hypothetical protein PHZ19_03240 [Candidatus Thermoplasmatota archaeon]|nr:hypothetical protein [Candidatus Thermoplasmatota archaeon]